MSSRAGFSPAAERNRIPIGRVLARCLHAQARVLEIGSGSGQHAVWLHRCLPQVEWQCTELTAMLPALAGRLAAEAPALPSPLALDVADDSHWPPGPWDAVFTANTLHIMPWENAGPLVRNAAKQLVSEGRLIIYGPFHEAGHFAADSNRHFDADLRRRDPAMGIRDALEVGRLAAAAGLRAEADLAMPANNRILIFRKSA